MQTALSICYSMIDPSSSEEEEEEEQETPRAPPAAQALEVTQNASSTNRSVRSGHPRAWSGQVRSDHHRGDGVGTRDGEWGDFKTKSVFEWQC